MVEYEGYLLDMDGVLYKDSEVIQSAIDAVNAWKSQNKKVFFMTNNSTRLPSGYREILTKIGVEKVEEKEIITSGTITIDYLSKRLIAESQKKRVLCVTEEAVKILLRKIGMGVVPDHVYKNVDYVVVGETNFDRQRLYYAVNAIKPYGAEFIATNPDPTDPGPDDELKPVAGAIIAYIQACTGIEPTILGKPFPKMYEVALDRMLLQPSDVLVIGDRLDTDIKGALDLKINAALVETGSHKREDIEKLGITPTHIVKELTELL